MFGRRVLDMLPHSFCMMLFHVRIFAESLVRWALNDIVLSSVIPRHVDCLLSERRLTSKYTLSYLFASLLLR